MAGLCDTVCWLWSPPSRHRETPAFYYWDHFHWMVGVLIRYLQNLVAQQLHWVESVIDKNGNRTSIISTRAVIVWCYHLKALWYIYGWSIQVKPCLEKLFKNIFPSFCQSMSSSGNVFFHVKFFFFLNWEGSSRWLEIEGLTFRQPVTCKWLDFEDGFLTGCRNVSHQQQSFIGLQSPRWSFSIKVCYSWDKTIF